MRIVLVGCRGAGKTAVGKIVTRRLHLNFLDTDEIVEEAAGKTVSEIFRLLGERYFRTAESKIIRSVSDRDDVVIAAGGGAPMRKSNITNLKKGNAIIFYLTAPAETLYQRCKRDSRTPGQRPSLTCASGIAEMRKLLKAREQTYQSIADVTIDTSHSTPSQVASAVIRLAGKVTRKGERGLRGEQREAEGRQRRAQGAHLRRTRLWRQTNRIRNRK
jgi:shikimate kinase